mgnify:CR=1 FL=1|tara:strand:+ start:37 stop:369 length:333 start_codon:yes stop_codon:yes gene_type:complete
MDIQPQEIKAYINAGGKSPYQEWLHSLKDVKTRARIRQRVDRLELGNFGDCESAGDGVYELRLDFGPGYRIYFGQVDKTMVLLLCGGTKRKQQKDIDQAKKYWKDYQLED